jgi:hypothetical protein
MDSSESPTYGEQKGSAYNGHFGCTCYHPLFVFNQFGDVERCALRPGNVHSADGWRAVLEPVIARYRSAIGPMRRCSTAWPNVLAARPEILQVRRETVGHPFGREVSGRRGRKTNSTPTDV